MALLNDEVMIRVRKWLDGPFDETTKQQIRTLLDKDPKLLADAFFKDLSFGTGGMRGVMGIGTNRLNIYTIRLATQGLANYLKQNFPAEDLSVFIGYDVRHHSREFANEAAHVLAGNQIRVLLSHDICPTPLTSFACRHFHCSAAIMITASHNPPAYNGYKVYWSDGGQVVFPHDEGIMEQVHAVKDLADVRLSDTHSPLINEIGNELDKAYLDAIRKLQLYPELGKTKIQILYTPLHGTGIRLAEKALASWGYRNVYLVPEQKNPDPDFTNAPLPNPEDPKALAIGTEELMAQKRDLLIATDPDADRMGVVVLDKGKGIRLSGNQIACLCLFHICSALQEKNMLPQNGACIKTIVTTELFRAIAESFQIACIDLLTGFKYIGEQMTLWEKSFDGLQYLFGAEESYGYLFGGHVRDKDGMIAACLIAEAAALAKKQNMTLIDRLYQIYEHFGVHREALISLSFPETAAGMQQMHDMMERLRSKCPSCIDDVPVLCVEDYQTKIARNLQEHTEKPLLLPTSDVLRFWLKDRTKLVIRPSGTEPKVKIYAEVVQERSKNVEAAIQRCDDLLKKRLDAFKALCAVPSSGI